MAERGVEVIEPGAGGDTSRPLRGDNLSGKVHALSPYIVRPKGDVPILCVPGAWGEKPREILLTRNASKRMLKELIEIVLYYED